MDTSLWSVNLFSNLRGVRYVFLGSKNGKMYLTNTLPQLSQKRWTLQQVLAIPLPVSDQSLDRIVEGCNAHIIQPSNTMIWLY